jgi:hypothetical protein
MNKRGDAQSTYESGLAIWELMVLVIVAIFIVSITAIVLFERTFIFIFLISGELSASNDASKYGENILFKQNSIVFLFFPLFLREFFKESKL